MPKMAKSDRQAKRIPKSSGHECLRRSSRKGRPHEYLKAPGTNAANAQVGREGPTNTKKFRAQMPQAVKSEGNAIRIPKSTRYKCLRRSSRKGRPYEYQKAPGTNATKGQVEPAGNLFPCHQCYSNDNKRDSQYFPESEEGMEEEESKDDG